MRLIDADALIQKLYEMKAKEEQYIGLENDVSVTIGSIGFEVMNMPTAYDVDKVVDELKEMKTIDGSMKTKLCIKFDEMTVNRAIEIVKQGVKE